MKSDFSTIKWTAVVPVALVAIALVAAIWLDVTQGGAANPADPIGEQGTPVRYAYSAPTPVPFDATPRARPTFAGVAQGSSAERDDERRTDLLLLLDAANRLRERDGQYPSTNGNVQTLCAYAQYDVACKLKDVLPELPIDPLGDPVKNGYWYSSDGQTVRFYASLEGEIPDEEQCDTNDVELNKRAYVICIQGP